MGTLHPIKQNQSESTQPGNERPKVSKGDPLLAFKVAHAIPGRLRFAFPNLIHKRDIVTEIAAYLSSIPGVMRTGTNHLCGSITVEYDGHLVDETALVEWLDGIHEKDFVFSQTGDQTAKQGQPKNQKTTKRPVAVSSVFWTVAGTLFVGLSFLGVIIPGLPTPPFVILAAYCYLRGSESRYRWIMNHRLFGKLLEETESGPRITRNAKKVTVYFFWLSIFLSCIFFVQSLFARLFLFLVGIAVSAYMLRR